MDALELKPGTIDAIVFDVIGTLVDEEPVWSTAARELAVQTGVPEAANLGALWARLLEERMQAVVRRDAAWRPHQQLVVEAAREAVIAAGGVPEPPALALVGAIDGEYRAWPDVAAATASLRRGRLVAALSNGDLASLARLASVNAINWDAVLSTGTIATFKPAPVAYQYAIDALQLTPERTLFVAAHPWDLRAAANHGMRTAYVARAGAQRPAGDDRFDLRVDDLSQLAALLI